MIQYTTPTFLFDINVPENVIDNIEVTFKQANTGVEIQKELVKDRLAIIDNKLNVHLSESETGKFSVGSCQVQMRVLTTDGKVLASEIARIKVEPSLSDDVLIEGVSDGEDSSYDAGYADGYYKGVEDGKQNAPSENLSVTLTSNGTYSYEKPNDKYYSDVEVVVNVPSEKTPTQEKSKTITKNGTEVISPDAGYVLEKVTVITDIPERLPTQTKTVDIEENGTEEVVADSGYALEKVIINTDIDTRLPEQTKEVTITENGTTNVIPDSGYTLAGVSVTTNIDTRLPEQEKSLEVTENKVYEVTPDTGYALKKVTVTGNVASSGGDDPTDPPIIKINTIPSSQFVTGLKFTDLFDYTSVDWSELNKKKITKFNNFFEGFKLKKIDVSELDISNATDVSYMFRECKYLESLDVSNWDSSKIASMSYFVEGCSQLKTVKLFPLTGTVYLNYIFSSCGNLESVDFQPWKSVISPQCMSLFGYCNKLTTLDFTGFDTSQTTNMNNMFQSCSSLTNVIFGNNWASHKQITSFNMAYSPLSKASILDLANKIADKSDKTVYTSTYKVYLKSSQQSLFTEEELTALAGQFTAKNWTLAWS